MDWPVIEQKLESLQRSLRRVEEKQTHRDEQSCENTMKHEIYSPAFKGSCRSTITAKLPLRRLRNNSKFSVVNYFRRR